jgi:hypothetical protein
MNRHGTTPRPRAVRLAHGHATLAFTLLVRAGAIVPVSPEPGVYAWAPAAVDQRVLGIAARAAADLAAASRREAA